MTKFDSIPAAFQVRNQWCVCGPDKRPLTPATRQPASVTNLATWGTFAEACANACPYIGYCFDNDFVVIDLDNPAAKMINGEKVTNPNTAEVDKIRARQDKIANYFSKTYQEKSISGLGTHIVGIGKVAAGRRKDNVEVYSSGRFIIFTGDSLNDAPPIDIQDGIDFLLEDMGPANKVWEDVPDEPQSCSDEHILSMGVNAENAAKWNYLFDGQMNGHPSQSEADMALLSMICFYTHNNAQAKRVFRISSLGKREKAMKNDVYLDRTIRTIRARKAAEVLPLADFSELRFPGQSEGDVFPIPALPSVPTFALPPVPRFEMTSWRPLPIPPPTLPPVPTLFPLPVFPPGLLGEIAAYIYSTSKRPIYEVALGSAIAFLAAIVGRQFNISGSGLNFYIIITAPTGVGKEDGTKGISRLVAAILPWQPAIENHIGPSAFASGQAIRRLFDKRKCMLAQLGEAGHTFKQWFDPRAPANVVGIRKELLDIFSKSGHQDFLGASVYADSDKNASRVHAPCLSLLCDTTPKSFFGNLDLDMLAEGFITRCNIFEHTGARQYGQKKAFGPPAPELVVKLAALVQMVTAMEGNTSFVHIGQTPEAEFITEGFDHFCTDQINTSSDEVVKQLWTRTHFKALKLAGLIAVGVNPQDPVVTADVAQMCITTATEETRNMERRFAKGEVGHGDHEQEAEIRKAIVRYQGMTPEQRGNNNVSEGIRNQQGIVPFAFLKKSLATKSAFKNDRRGSAAAMKVALDDMIKAGTLVQVAAPIASATWGVRNGIVYQTGENW